MSELLVGTSIADSNSGTGLGENNGAPPAPFRENEIELDAALSKVERHVRDAWSQWLAFATDNIEDKLTALLKEAAASHRSRLEQFIADAERDKSGATILEYRRSVEREVVRLLQERLEARNVGRAIDARFDQTIEAIATTVSEIPESVRLSQPPELFHRDDDDNLVVKTRKLGRRTRLQMAAGALALRNRLRSMIGRDELRQVPPSRIVPARQLAAAHLTGVLPAVLEEDREARQIRVARKIADAEHALTDWVNRILTEERDAEMLFESAVRPRWDTVSHEQKQVGEERDGDTNDPDASETHEDVDDDSDPSTTNEEGLDIFQRIREIGEELDTRLSSIGQPWGDAAPAAAPFEAVFSRFRSDLDKAGTFLHRSDERLLREGSAKSNAATSWAEWHEQAADRLRYLDSLLLIRDRMLKAESSIVERTSRATVMPVISTFVQMKEQFARCMKRAETRAQSGKTADPDTYSSDLAAIKDELSNTLRSVFSDLPGLVSSDQALSDPGKDEWEGLGKFVDGLPEKLVIHELYDADEAITPTSRTAEINFRGLVNDVLLIRLPDRLRKPAEELRSSVRRVWTETEQIEHIVQYNLDAAIDELRQKEGKREEHPDSPDEEPENVQPATPGARVDQARQLTVDSLTRASNTLDQLASSLKAPWNAFVEAIDHELREDWVAIHRRLKAADSADEQWASFRARTTRRLEKFFSRIRVATGIVAQRISKVVTAGRRRAESLIKIGQSAVGVVDSGDAERFETIDALSSVKEMRKELPLIYRRLFSFEPLDEPTLLEGRARDLVWVKRHFDRWHEAKQMGVVLIQASLGSGRTSFLNALEKVVLKDYEVRQINLPERIYHPDEFAAIVATALEIDEPNITLDELEERLLRTRRSDPPHVCLIDNLEHLLIRAPQAVNLMERVILFLSHTDSSIYWVGTIGSYTWQFLSKTAATAVSFVDSYALTPLDRSTIESLVINRHRRSGMPLHFPEPKDPPAIMRQRLRRAKTPEQRQALLREDFFDRLSKASGENVMLALYYWIRSTDFSSEEGALHVKPLKPLNFDFLGRFDLDHAFTLKAFFLHKTLSLDDHRRIFHVGKEASTAILESLLNWRIIEPVPHSERVQTDYHVQREAIYRLNPLLIHPVTVFLQSKNIVY